MAIMQSIKPEYCALIAQREKTIELRKSIPKDLIPPFKVYIYCTSVKHMNLDEYVRLHQTTGGRIDDWHGKVIGEYICDNIFAHPYFDSGFHISSGYVTVTTRMIQKMCLDLSELEDYGNCKKLYGWHISDLIIYNKSKDLIEFGLKRPPQSWYYVKELI